MEKLINTITTDKAAEITGKIINVLIAVSGAIFCSYGVYLQVTGNLF